MRHSFLSQKVFVHTRLSENLTKLALLSEKKWEVYQIDQDTPDRAPQLLCCGKNNGDHGPSFDHLYKMKKSTIIKYSNFSENSKESMDLLSDWEHITCRVTENLLVIAGSRGFLRVLDLNANGRVLYTYQSKFPIRCIDVSPNEQFISLGITGKDKYTTVESAFVILLRLQYLDGGIVNNNGMTT
ncbi:unnamed protein product [Ambrosiozyma monospora]|uniref:Unnamed protein product n=1 Tax=Ambrosiozyma monospora TaxID=43982 RepID=A0A9W6T6K8_AMBMO|nr:unnamed protein product [Ambrosiozyma monospora]